jgi:hypothetical protein
MAGDIQRYVLSHTPYTIHPAGAVDCSMQCRWVHRGRASEEILRGHQDFSCQENAARDLVRQPNLQKDQSIVVLGWFEGFIRGPSYGNYTPHLLVLVTTKTREGCKL